MNIVPMNGCVFVRVDEEQTKTESGILLKEGSVRLPQTGTVVSMADDVFSQLEEGDRVIFLRYASLDSMYPDIRICKLEHIVGLIEEEIEDEEYDEA